MDTPVIINEVMYTQEHPLGKIELRNLFNDVKPSVKWRALDNELRVTITDCTNLPIWLGTLQAEAMVLVANDISIVVASTNVEKTKTFLHVLNPWFRVVHATKEGMELAFTLVSGPNAKSHVITTEFMP